MKHYAVYHRRLYKISTPAGTHHGYKYWTASASSTLTVYYYCTLVGKWRTRCTQTIQALPESWAQAAKCQSNIGWSPEEGGR
jgi:hypothetical protein